MKTLLQTIILTFLSTTFFSQTLHFDSIPVPECIQWNLYEPSFGVSPTGRLHYGGRVGTYSSSDNGANWDTATYDWTNFAPMNCMAVSPVSGNVYIGASDYGGFAMSTDSGVSFTRKNTTYCNAIYADKYGNIFAGLSGALIKFKDGNYALNRVLLASIYAISEGEQGELYAVSKKKIYMSTDTGNTWIVKKDITSSSRGQFNHVVAGSNGDIFYGERYTSLHKTDTSFLVDTVMSNRPALNSIKTDDGFIFMPTSFGIWGMSFDNGQTFTDYWGSSFNTLTAGVRVPTMSNSEYPYHSLATYNNKVYFAGYNCQILVLSKGTQTSLEEKGEVNTIAIYPNPIQEGATMSIKGVNPSDRVVIRDIFGKEIEGYQNGTNRIQLDSYKRGVYLLTIYSSKGIQTKKFVVN